MVCERDVGCRRGDAMLGVGHVRLWKWNVQAVRFKCKGKGGIQMSSSRTCGGCEKEGSQHSDDRSVHSGQEAVCEGVWSLDLLGVVGGRATMKMWRRSSGCGCGCFGFLIYLHDLLS